MPIKINFLAEQQEAEEMRRRDPLKRAAIGGGVIVFLGVLACLYFQVKASGVQSQLQAKKDQLAEIEKTSKVVGENKKKTGELEDKAKLLHELAVNRVQWGPVLNSLQIVMAEISAPQGGIQVSPITLLRFTISQRYDHVEAVKPKPGSATKPKPATSTEKIAFTLEGRDYGTEQEQNYNLLKEKLSADPYLRNQLRKDNPVRLQGFKERQTDPLDPSKTFVTFALECNFPEKVR